MKEIVKQIVDKHGAVVLSIVATAGVIATGVAAAKASPVAMEKLRELEEENEHVDSLEKVKAVAPIYGPTIAFGAGTIGCIAGITLLDRKHQATVMGAYALLSKSYNQYRDKVKEVLGIESYKKVNEEIAKDKLKNQKLEKVPTQQIEEMGGNDICVFYEATYDKVFERSFVEVLDAEYQLNRSLALNGFVSLADFYDLLGLDRTPESEALGWNQEMGFETGVCTWIDFTHELMEMADGLKGYVITPSYEPIYGYDEWMKNF